MRKCRDESDKNLKIPADSVNLKESKNKQSLLNLISLLIFSISGFAILWYALLKRKRQKEKESVEKKEDPISHITDKLFFGIPIERILVGYFAITGLIYLGKLLLAERWPGADLAVIYLSGITFLLGVYKISMRVGVVRKFSPWLFFSTCFSLLIFIAVLYGLTVNLPELLKDTHEYNLAIHLLGLTMGLGGTFIIDIMFSHFMRNYTFSASESLIMHLISQMIIFGLILLILSGAALLILDYESFLKNPRFIMKMIVVGVVILNGAVLNLYITPKMEKISLLEEENYQHERLNKISFALGAVSIVSWLTAFLLAMLKELFDQPLQWLLLGYTGLIVLSVLLSQLAKLVYERKENYENN